MTRFFRWLSTALPAVIFGLIRRWWLAWFTLFAWFLRLPRGQAPRTDPPLQTQPGEPPDEAPDESPGASGMLHGQYTCAFGKRSYRLFVPAPPATRTNAPPRPLLVMLHGCKQTPDDFATGTRMNTLAQAAQCLVLYPAQSRWANPYGCWNWFGPQHQMRDLGEPAILAGMLQAVAAEHRADARRVYVAGLSAGAAMAVNLVHAYPELFAAVGVHSGLAYGVAQDAGSAMQAMKQGDLAPARIKLTLPMLVFQGDSDAVVHPQNAAALLAQAGVANQPPLQTHEGQASAGHAYTRLRYSKTAEGAPVQIEYWRVTGLGHAWSGGDAAGSFTDPQGPDASAEMLRFFLAQARNN